MGLDSVNISEHTMLLTCLTRAGAGVALAPGPHPALRVGVSGAPGAVVLHPGAGVIQVILKWLSSKLSIG